MVDQQLHYVVASLVRCAHQGNAPVQRVLRVHIGAHVQEHLHRVIGLLRRPLVGDSLDPADSARDHQRGHAVIGCNFRVRSMLEEQLQQHHVP